MDVTSTLDAPYDAERVFTYVADLASYPRWLDLVSRVDPAEPSVGDEGPAYLVQLRARIGPLARSKRLRMVRTVCVAPAVAVFERQETDGRQHSPWVLRASVDGLDGATSRLTMSLHYGGSMFDALVERLLHREIDQAKPRLLRLLGT